MEEVAGSSPVESTICKNRYTEMRDGFWFSGSTGWCRSVMIRPVSSTRFPAGARRCAVAFQSVEELVPRIVFLIDSLIRAFRNLLFHAQTDPVGLRRGGLQVFPFSFDCSALLRCCGCLPGAAPWPSLSDGQWASAFLHPGCREKARGKTNFHGWAAETLDLRRSTATSFACLGPGVLRPSAT